MSGLPSALSCVRACLCLCVLVLCWSPGGFQGPWTRAPTTFSNEYYRLLLEEEWSEKAWSGPRQFENAKTGADVMMLPSDIALIQDRKMKRYVEAYAADEKVFFNDFAAAFTKLMELGVNFDKKTQKNLQK